MPPQGSNFDPYQAALLDGPGCRNRLSRLRAITYDPALNLVREVARFSQQPSNVVFSVIRLFPGIKRRAQVIELLRSVRDWTRACPGCLGCWFLEEDILHNHIRYAEQWESEEALFEHIRSDLYRRLLEAMELSKKPPEVSFYYCSQTKGLELVEAARRHITLGEPVPSP